MASREGSPNKSKQALIKLLQARYPDYQPVMEMAESAMEITKLAREAKHDPDLWMQSANAHDKVAQYTTPKLKAVQITGEDGGPIKTQTKLLNVVGVKPSANPDTG